MADNVFVSDFVGLDKN